MTKKLMKLKNKLSMEKSKPKAPFRSTDWILQIIRNMYFLHFAIWEKLYWNFVVTLFRNTNFWFNILTSWKSIFEMKNNKSYLLNICDIFLQQELALTPPGVSLVVWILVTLHDTHIPLPTKSLKLPGSQSTHTDDAFSVLPTSQTKIRKSKVNLC